MVQVLNGIDNSLQMDHTKKWSEISRNVLKHTMKEIGKALTGRFRYKEVELKWVLQNLHRHRRENWKISLDPNKVKSEKRRKGMNSRRMDVSTGKSNNMKPIIIGNH